MTAVPKGKGSVDRSALPRYPDDSPWWPPGLPADADDEALARALRAAWGTPRWVLDLALDVREMLGGPAASLGFDLDAGTRPGTASWALAQWHVDGTPKRGDALDEHLVWFYNARAWHWARYKGQEVDADLFESIRPMVWCNFPFNRPGPWVTKAIRAADEGCWVSVLAPHTTGAWWDDLRCSMVAEVPLRKVCFEACPGLLDARGRPASGDAPSQQCSLVTLAPPQSCLIRREQRPRILVREVPKLGPQRFALLPGPGAA